MNYFDAIDYIEKLRLEGSFSFDNFKNTLQFLNETTTEGDIAYIPAHLGAVKKRVADLAKLKKDWKIEILEQDDSREVSFEDSFRIRVPHEYWDSFCSIFDSAPSNNEYLNLTTLLNETLEDEMKDLRQELRVVLAHLYDTDGFKELDDKVTSWVWRFRVRAYDTLRSKKKAAVVQEIREKGIQRLYDKLLRVYGEDRGNLEMLIEAIKNRDPLSSFDVFKNYDYLYGTRIHSSYHGIDMYFEAAVDTDYHNTETIYIPEADDLLDKVDEESSEVKRVHSVLYPKGGQFTYRFFHTLAELSEDLGEEE